jgi:DeoR/GlpR family transcriptional regulator of sugar metabolism
MINDGDTIFLDASTSSLHLARCIKEKRGLTVITNADKVVGELSGCDEIHVVSTGGELNSRNMSFVGKTAEKAISESYFADKFFFSCKGVTINRGLVDASDSEAEIKKVMMKNSETTVFLCDHDKLGKLAVPFIANFDAIDCMITDVRPDEKWVDILRDNDVELVIVD